LVNEPEAIFIVGASRSGTTLMRQLLERSERIAIARENHYLGHVRQSEGARYYFRTAADPASDEAIKRVVEMIYGGEFQRLSRRRDVSGFWTWLVDSVPRDEMERRLLAAERSERGMFAAFLRAYADSEGKPILGEKTPAHVAHVDTLLEWFPDARVVHMIRDPRAVYVSDLRRRRTRAPKRSSLFRRIPRPLLPAVVLVQTILLWRDALGRHARYVTLHAERYHAVRFEDLVKKPDQTLAELYHFLGVPMPVAATDVKVVSRGFRAGEQGLDPEAADRWRQHIGGGSRRIIQLALGRQMRAVGYE
jgi:hypothetical protein